MLPFSIINKYGNILPHPVMITSVKASTLHIGVLYDTGELYLRGSGASYKLGNNTTASNQGSWYKTLEGVKYFALAQQGSFAVKTDGSLWFVGYQRLINGGGGTSSYITTWTNYTSTFAAWGIDTSLIVQIRCTGNCTLFLLSTGALYGVGVPTAYELGTNATTAVTTPILIASNAKFIRSSNDGFGYVTTSGIYYRSGGGGNYQLGSSGALRVFTAWNSTGVVLDLALGQSQSYLLYNNGDGIVRYYTAGNGNNGQNGINVNGTNTTYGTTSVFDGMFSSFKQGGYNNLNMFVIGTSTGLYSTGLNSAGQLGDGTQVGHTTGWVSNSIGFESAPMDLIKGIAVQFQSTSSTFTLLWYGNKIYYSGTVGPAVSTWSTTYQFLELTDLPYNYN